MGSIVLIKYEEEAKSYVVDGQQRLTTLTILIAAMIDQFQSLEHKIDMRDFIKAKGSTVRKIEAKPRLFLRERDENFFQYYIQDVHLDELNKIDPVSLDTEAKKHIQENCHLLRERLQEKFGGNEHELLEFSSFVVNRCFLVCVSTPTQTSAFRIFSVMNSRGLDLLPIDIIKSDIIGKLLEEEQEEYTKKWEDLENEVGREGFNEVFILTRTIFVKERAKKNLLEEFREGVLSKTTPKSLIDDYLVPYTNAYACLKGCCYESTQNAEEINQYLYWLNRTNSHDWMAPAILFLASNPNSTDVLWFIQKLERLASYLLVTGQNIYKRFDRYKRLLNEMDSSSGLESIELTEVEKKEFISALDGEIYLMPPWRRNYIIQRLDSFVSAGGATYDVKVFTIEHVLPQNPAPDGEWMRIWPDAEQRKVWLNRIANLVPLTRIKNSAAQNYGFAKKKEKYFQSRRGVSSYALTTQVLGYESWTPEQVEKRQRELLNVFCEKWDLAEDKEKEI